MTTGPNIEPAGFLHEQLTHASPDLLRDLLASFVDRLMGAEADAIPKLRAGAYFPDRTSII